jgi:hypothetical protein
MDCYLEVIDVAVWRLVHKGMNPLKDPEKPTTCDEQEIHLNVRAKKCFLEYFSMEIFKCSPYQKKMMVKVT